MSVEGAADAIEEIIANQDEAKRRAENALTWIKSHTWTDVCKDWKKLFEEAKLSLDKKREFLKTLETTTGQ